MSGSRRYTEGGTAVPPRDRGHARQGPVLHRPVGQAPQPHPPARALSGEEARGLLERELAALSMRPADMQPAPGPAMPMERRQPPAPPGPMDYRPAPSPPAAAQPARAMPVQHRPPAAPPRPAEHWPAPPPRPGEHWPAAGRRRQAAGPEWAAHTEDRVPYTSLMAALSTATPAVLAETVKPAPQERARPARKRKRLPWRSAVTILALAATAALPVYTLWNGGKGAGAGQAGHPQSVAPSEGVLSDVPLPSRRPAALGGQHSPGRNAPASPAEK